MYQVLFFGVVLSMLTVGIGMMPGKAAAAEINVQTNQVLPPGGNGCTLLPATSFTPYEYNGALDSFEFTVPDASYVAITGSVGNTPLSFLQMTRKIDASGNLRVHVDIPSMSLTNTIPIQIILMSSPPGQPTCLSIASMTVGSGPTLPGPVSQTAPSAPVTSIPSNPTNNPTYTNPTPAPAGTSMTPISKGGTSGTSGNTATATSIPGGTSSTAAGSVLNNSMQNPLKALCATQSGAYRLWLVLLVLYVLLIGALLWAEWPLSWDWIRMPEWITAGILVPFILLMGFWYFSVSCRAGWFVPVIAIIIALAGLFAAFWNHPRVTQLLLIEDSNV